MTLSDKTLMKMLEERTLVVTFVELEQIQPASIAIRIGNTCSIVEDKALYQQFNDISFILLYNNK